MVLELAPLSSSSSWINPFHRSKSPVMRGQASAPWVLDKPATSKFHVSSESSGNSRADASGSDINQAQSGRKACSIVSLCWFTVPFAPSARNLLRTVRTASSRARASRAWSPRVCLRACCKSLEACWESHAIASRDKAGSATIPASLQGGKPKIEPLWIAMQEKQLLNMTCEVHIKPKISFRWNHSERKCQSKTPTGSATQNWG